MDLKTVVCALRAILNFGLHCCGEWIRNQEISEAVRIVRLLYISFFYIFVTVFLKVVTLILNWIQMRQKSGAIFYLIDLIKFNLVQKNITGFN